MKKRIFLLAALLILSFSPGDGFAQVRLTVNISPEQPTAFDDVVATFSGEMNAVSSWNNSFAIEGERIVCELRAVLSPLAVWLPFQFSHNFGRLEPGRYSLLANLYCAAPFVPEDFQFVRQAVVQFSVTPVSAVLSLAEGWNLVSSWVEPEDNDIPSLMSGLTDAGVLNIIKDYTGRFYCPRYEFNNIPGWSIGQGYFINVTRNAELEICGAAVEADTPIPLQSGWNMVAYYPEAEAEAPEAFRNIRDALRLAKDGAGHFYSPANNFNNIPSLHRGAGYQVNTAEEVVLIWGAE